MADDKNLSREEIRSALIAKINAAAPQFAAKPEIAHQIALANNEELRKHLVWAELVADASAAPAEPVECLEPSPRIPAEERELLKWVLSTKTGAGLPPHEYVLARNECAGFYDGPAWVPFNLWSTYKFEGDSRQLVRECARKLIETAGVEELWSEIARRFYRPDSVAGNLPVACANAITDWSLQPRDTPSEFKEKREELGRRAKQLALELERFFLARDPDEHEQPGLLDFTQLMTDDERERLDVTIRRMTGTIRNEALGHAGVRHIDWDEYNDDDNGNTYSHARQDARLIYGLMLRDHSAPHDYPYGGVPTLPDMLRRIGDKFIADGESSPLSRPNAANAERNFFARAVIKFFLLAGDVSPLLVARIVSIFFVQGVTENEVSQMIRKFKAENPLPEDPADSETSPKK